MKRLGRVWIVKQSDPYGKKPKVENIVRGLKKTGLR